MQDTLTLDLEMETLAHARRVTILGDANIFSAVVFLDILDAQEIRVVLQI